MDGLAVMLRLRGRRVVVVGGGAVAARRAGAMARAGAQVAIIAPQVSAACEALGATIHRRHYEEGDLAGATLVVIATDDPVVNQRVAHDAAAEHVLVNRTDDVEQSDVVVMAGGECGPVRIAVHTGGVSAAAAAAIRDELIAAIRPAWPTLLTIVEPYRAVIRDRITDADERQRRLRELASPAAMDVLQAQGEAALRQRCERLANPDAIIEDAPCPP
jgi:siroheme synthase-like protein